MSDSPHSLQNEPAPTASVPQLGQNRCRSERTSVSGIVWSPRQPPTKEYRQETPTLEMVNVAPIRSTPTRKSSQMSGWPEHARGRLPASGRSSLARVENMWPGSSGRSAVVFWRRIMSAYSTMGEQLLPLMLVRSSPNRGLYETFRDKVPWDEVRRVTGDDMSVEVMALFRILGAPDAPAVFPEAPELGDPVTQEGDRRWIFFNYWYPLIHMLRFSLGWARLDKGLWWWYQQGKPRDDPRLRILADIYDADGRLDGFCAWLWKGGPGVPTPFPAEMFGWHDTGDQIPADPPWIASRLKETGLTESAYDFLHLSGHAHVPLEGRQGGFYHLHSSSEERRAVVVFDNMVGWYRGLNDVETYLPKLKDRSWYIEVFTKPNGWLGTYRRSRVTGLWFSGQHRLHTPGT